MSFRKTAIATTIGSLTAGLLAATPAYAVKVNDNLDLNVKIFADFTSVDGTGSSTSDDASSGFHFTRAYFEARGKVSPDDMVRLTLDQKSPADSKDSTTGDVSKADGRVFVKYAYWQHKYSDAASIKVGQNHTPLVDYIQTDLWGHRYVQKTFTDYWGAETSSDLGISVLGDGGESFSYYVSLMNGEGYQHKTDGAGYALMGRAEWHGAGAHVGLYGHSETDRNGTSGYDPTREELYAWWENDTFRIGGQYLMADDGDAANTDTKLFNDATGYNVLANLKVPSIGKKTAIFVRYDSIDKRDNGTDSTLSIAGVEFEAAKGVMVAVDYQSEDPGTTGSQTVDTVAVNGQFKF